MDGRIVLLHVGREPRNPRRPDRGRAVRAVVRVRERRFGARAGRDRGHAVPGRVRRARLVVAGTPFKVGWKGPERPAGLRHDRPARAPSAGPTRATSTRPTATPGARRADQGGRLPAVVRDRPGGQGQAASDHRDAVHDHARRPGTVAPGSQFQVTWTGPNGPSDYITIVPAGSRSGPIPRTPTRRRAIR